MGPEGRLLLVLVVGGDTSRHQLEVDGATVERAPSSGAAGTRRIAALAHSIRHGNWDLVVCLTSWLGHGDMACIKRACRASQVPVRFVRGAAGVVRRQITSFQEAFRD